MVRKESDWPNEISATGSIRRRRQHTHEYCERVVRDLPILGRAVRLSVLFGRVGCRDCGKRMEVVSWLDRYARMTRRLADAVIQACERLPTMHVAQMFGLHWDTVPLLERRALQAALSMLPKAQPRRLVMDELALFKGHRYASVVLDADTRRVLWIALAPFKDHGCRYLHLLSDGIGCESIRQEKQYSGALCEVLRQ
jgi:transposase